MGTHIRFLAVGNLTVRQAHPRFRLEVANRRSFVDLAPETSRIQSGGVGINGCSAGNNVLIAADHLTCAILNFAFGHDSSIVLSSESARVEIKDHP
jgi:hypothetical protein